MRDPSSNGQFITLPVYPSVASFHLVVPGMAGDAPSRRSVRSLLNLGNLGKIKIGGRGTIRRHQITIAGPGREGHFTSSVIRRMINWPNGMGSLVDRATGQDVAQEIERN